MKIAFAYDLPFPWHKGGIEKIMNEESIELAKANDVHFFTLRWQGMEKEFVKDKVHYHAYFSSSIDTAYRHGRRSIRKGIVFALSLWHLFNYRFDVLIIDQFPYLHIPIAWLFCKMTGCKLVMKVAEIWDKNYWEDYINPFVGGIAYLFSRVWVRSADLYIADSLDTRDRLEAFTGKHGKSIIFSPVLNNDTIRTALAKKNKIADVMFVGRLIKEKRLDKWVDAVVKAHGINESINGAIIGDGIERENITELIKHNDAESFISLLNKVENTVDLYKMIAASTVLLNMSEREGLSIISLESLALGTPVLLPSYTPIPDEVRSMCVVEEESRIPEKIVEICRSRKDIYIRSVKGLEKYYTFDIQRYYEIVFERLGLTRRST